MTLLEWKPAYSLGIASVDLEHREMIQLINDCYERLSDVRDIQAIEQFLGEIHAGIAAHFALEEHLMRQADYPAYPAHKADHEVLLDELRALMDAFDDDPGTGVQLLRERLGGWFERHFATHDARLHRYLPEDSPTKKGLQ